jgi:sn-glycerol 3-phosphate transport system substrate-binding protein
LKQLMIIVITIAIVLSGCSSSSTQSTAAPSGSSDKPVEIEFYFPVIVGGPITKIVDKLAADFQKENPNIKVTPIFGGTYPETMTKVMTAVQGNNAPALAVLMSTELYTLLSANALEKLNGHFPEEYLSDFYDGFMNNSRIDKDVWSLPFQRSTTVLYYNKDAFKAAGLDPEKPPANWTEMREYAEKLTVKDSGGSVKQWGVEIPSTGYQYWLFQALALQTSGKNLMSSDGKSVFFDSPENQEALQYYVDLGKKYKVMPEGTIEWATAPSDFLSGKTAMMYHTTGNLTKVKTDAKFNFGVAFLPANKQYGTATGGGNLYVFKNVSEEKKKAALKFAEFLTTPERVAQWSIDTGYVAARKKAYETDLLKNYIKDFPQAKVAMDQLQYAYSELSTYQSGQVQKILNDTVQAALSGTGTVPDLLKKAQTQADQVLKNYK